MKKYKTKLLYCRDTKTIVEDSLGKINQDIKTFKPSIVNGFFIKGEKISLRTAVARCFFAILTFGKASIFYLTDSNDELIHTSYLIPYCFKFPFMKKYDFEIGPCYTHPKYRGNGIYPMVLLNICFIYKGYNTVFYMIIDEKNKSSIRGVEKAGFIKCGKVYKNKSKRYKLIFD
jgi:hypothetical protein